MSFLLDTNVISELRKGTRCDPRVSAWFSELRDDEIFLSALTIGELFRGVESVRRRDPAGAQALAAWLGELVEGSAERILPVDLAVAEEWGRLNVPDPLPVVDGLLAATASVHGLRLATRNVRDVERSGVALFNPFAQ